MQNLVKDGHQNILLCGDFNDEFETVNKEMNNWKINVAKPNKIEDFFSRIDKKANKRSWLDYIGYSQDELILTRDERQYETDHILVYTELHNSQISKRTVSKYYKETVLVKELDSNTIEKIFLDEEWPMRPFIEIARKYGATQECRKTNSEFKNIKNLIARQENNKAQFQKVLNILEQLKRNRTFNTFNKLEIEQQLKEKLIEDVQTC